MRLTGAVVLVTGASSGIGAALVRRLAGAGSHVLAVGRHPDRLARLAAETDATTLLADLARPGAGRDLADRAVARYGRVDVLVNNAGTGWAGQFAGMTEATADELLTVNLRAPIELTRALLPGMCRHGGHLVFVGSIAGRLGVAEEAVYAASKAGLDTFAESLRLELAGRPVRVSTVVPGVVDTPFFSRRGQPYRRSRPRPVPADRVAAAVTTAITRNRAEVYVPGWLRLPVAVRGLLPAAYRRMATRFG
ncbi:SDR family NAD(P)-dependent oxidoreductase [Micromonospora yasonensis]|uniref:SDR family NAD(P)-dependent oxidoreductase n=1 Tax=Micromonospora yasonensis TaxID=1128667 RepID=UPI00222E92D5|nr:SDR family NAD(P)-dependent oxidoreductase [Micromonospora yasonensis]MCW3845251.1 SDR family NAD(P)-dependent oxidoreductase [Micromonospora yasonensis]